jgi:zinc D-Ala-D-Ala carboxypeptidase
MTQLTQHFSLAELTATSTGLDNIPTLDVLASLKVLAEGLEQVRTRLGHSIRISSGYRSLAVNTAVKGAKASQHLLGQAADFTCPGYGSPRQIMDAIVTSAIVYDQCILEYPEKGGWIHISFSDKPRKQAIQIDRTGTRIYVT